MSLNSYFLFGIFLIAKTVQFETQQREYVVVKDMVSGYKAGQFSVYLDAAEKNLRYRIESYHSPMPKIEIHAYPEKKSLGRLNAQQLGTWYQARFELLDTRNKSNNNKWYVGSIKRDYAWFSTSYTITLAERTIKMTNTAFSREFKFYNEGQKLLASYRKRRFQLRPATVYDLKIFSKEFSDGMYLFALAGHDHRNSRMFG